MEGGRLPLMGIRRSKRPLLALYPEVALLASVSVDYPTTYIKDLGSRDLIRPPFESFAKKNHVSGCVLLLPNFSFFDKIELKSSNKHKGKEDKECYNMVGVIINKTQNP